MSGGIRKISYKIQLSVRGRTILGRACSTGDGVFHISTYRHNYQVFLCLFKQHGRVTGGEIQLIPFLVELKLIYNFHHQRHFIPCNVIGTTKKLINHFEKTVPNGLDATNTFLRKVECSALQC